MIVVLITGKKGSGKDTVANELQSNLSKAIIQPNAKRVKEIAKEMGWNEKKDKEGRKLLVDITNAGYSYDHYMWEKLAYKDFLSRVNFVGSTSNNNLEANTTMLTSLNRTVILVPDWRYESTYIFYSQLANVSNIITVRVTRDWKNTSKENNVIEEDYDIVKASEENLSTLATNFIINNDTFGVRSIGDNEEFNKLLKLIQNIQRQKDLCI